LYEGLQASLLNALIKGGYEELTLAAHEYLKLPVMITDADYNCLAHIPDEPLGDSLWDTIHENGRPSLQFIQILNDENIMQTGALQRAPFYLNWGSFSINPRIVGNIFIDDAIAGYLAVPCASCNEELLEKAGLICQALTIEFQRRNIKAGNIPDAWSMFLSRLMHGKIREPDELKQWLRHLNRKIKGDFCVVAAQPAEGAAEKPLLPFIQKSIERIDPGLHPVIFDDSIYLLIMNHATNQECLDQLDSVTSALSSLGLRFGISNRFSDILQIEIYRDQALYALLDCLKTSDAKVQYYSGCALKQLFGTVVQNLPEQSYMHPALNMLEVYDQKNGTDYLRTLSAYIVSMCNSLETVRELHIHRNTLPYRLDVIERITGINLSDPRTCAHLLCSFYIREYS